MSTQWRVGFSGATGLDYGVLPEIWRRLKVPIDQRDEAFSGLRAIEIAALDVMREKRKDKPE